MHTDLQQFIDSMIAESQPGIEQFADYVESYIAAGQVTEYKGLLPLFAYQASGGLELNKVVPLVAAWIFLLSAADALDDVQDSDNVSVNVGLVGLGFATRALSRLNTDQDTLTDIMDAVGQIITIGAIAQDLESKNMGLTKQTYFSNILGKSAAIIATGFWIGGRLTTDDRAILTTLKEFGLALGMAIQISDDCCDLEEDLTNGVFTLPIIEALGSAHPKRPLLEKLIEHSPPAPQQVAEIIELLNEMGSVKFCRYQAEVYKAQATAAFEIIPGLEKYLGKHVAAVV